MAMSVRHRHALTVITPTIHTLVRRTATMVRNGLRAASSSALAPGITAFTGGATATTDAAMVSTVAEDMATDAAITDPALMPTTGAVDLVMAEAMQAAAFMAAAGSTGVAAVFMAVADAAKPTKLSGRTRLAGQPASRFVLRKLRNRLQFLVK